MHRIFDMLIKPVSGKRISLFRIIYGLFMIYEIADYMKIKIADNGMLQPGVLFTYVPFQFLEPLPSGAFRGLFLLMILAAIMITIGYHTKKASLFFSLGYFYFILLEKAYYNNHLYLFALIAFVLTIIESEEHFSLSKRMSGLPSSWVPKWNLLLIQWLIVMVYFFGGIAKLSNDWLMKMEPMKSARAHIPEGVWYTFIKQDWGLQFFTYGGLFIDLILSLCLFHRKLKWLAIPVLVIFNFMNAKLFNDIGIFPYFMVFAVLLFVTTDELRKFFPSLPTSATNLWTNPAPSSKWKQYMVSAFVIFHMIMPFRGHFFSENMDWTGIHQGFSWRMKSMSREIVEMKWVVINGETKESIPITHGQIINNLQIEVLARNAQSVLDFARHLKKEAIKRNIPKPEVRARIVVKFNGRQAQEYVKSDIDLASEAYKMSNTAAWLNPLQEP